MQTNTHPNDPLNLILNGRRLPFVPVAPSYENLGPLEFHRVALRWSKWRDRLDAAGTDRLPVEYQAYFDLELEIHTDILDTCYPPPAWLILPTISTPPEVAGATVERRGDDLYWVAADGDATWLPPSRQAYHTRMADERSGHYARLWSQGHNAGNLEEAAARAQREARPAPNPSPDEMAAERDSGRYHLARALLARHPGNLPLYSSYEAPYISLLWLLGFQRMMSALVDSPDLVHQVLEGWVPRPSAALLAQRSLGIGIMFVEESLSSADLISPDMYLEFSFPYTRRTLQFFEDLGFRTVLYFSGNLMPLLHHLKQLPFTAIIFEEDRKNYGIDLAEVRRVMGPDRVLYGNVDAHFLEKASDDEVLAEARRQIDLAGSDGNFVLSVGSPFTPDTTLDRVRLFCQSTQVI